MKKNRQSYLGLIMACFVGILLLSRCDNTFEEGDFHQFVSDSFEQDLESVRGILSSDPELAVSRLDQIVEQAKSASNPFYAGKALWYQAYTFDKKLDNVSKAYFGYNEALKYLNQTEDLKYKSKVINNLAILNQYYGHNSAAVDLYLDLLEQKDEMDLEFVSDVYFNLGRSYKLMRTEPSFIKAEEAFAKSMEIALEIDYHENIASVNNQVGTMYKDLKNYDMARIAYQNTIRKYENKNPDSYILDQVGKAYHGIGVTYMEEKDYSNSITAFQKALTYENKSSTIFVTKFDLGTVLEEAGYTEEAVATWKEALKENHNKNDRTHIGIYSKLTSTLALNNEYQEAIKYAQIYNEHIGNILSVGETYEQKNNQVIFADIVRDYAEFNQVIPWYKKPWALVLMFIFIALAVYAGSSAYYQSKLSTKVSDTRSAIQVEFQNIKLD